MEEVAAQIRVRRPDPVQLCAQEIDEAAIMPIVVQRDPSTFAMRGFRLGCFGRHLD
jgi:hypothetical protein